MEIQNKIENRDPEGIPSPIVHSSQYIAHCPNFGGWREPFHKHNRRIKKHPQHKKTTHAQNVTLSPSACLLRLVESANDQKPE